MSVLLLASLASFAVAGDARAEETGTEEPAPPPSEETPPAEEPPAEEPPAEEVPEGGAYQAGSCYAPQLEVQPAMVQPEREIRGLRNDLRAWCEEVNGQAVDQKALLEQVVSELGGIREELATESPIAERLGSISESTSTALAVQCAAPCPVRLDPEEPTLQVSGPSGTGESGGETGVVAVLEEGFGSLHYVLWFIAALVVGGVGAYALTRVVIFRDN
jgi:hypothetical protein